MAAGARARRLAPGHYTTAGAHEAWACTAHGSREHQPVFGAGDRRALAGGQPRPSDRRSGGGKAAAIRAHVRGAARRRRCGVLPSAASLAPLRDADPAAVDAVRMRTMAITCIAGLAGLPQVSLPCARLPASRWAFVARPGGQRPSATGAPAWRPGQLLGVARPDRGTKPRRAQARSRSRAARCALRAEGDDVEGRIYRTVFDSVMSQRLTPGTKLPEAALCELFGVSRSLVRKVLQRLAHDHIVQLRPNRGAIVAVPTREETRQIFEARRALEAAIVALAAERATKADLSALRAQLQRSTRRCTASTSRRGRAWPAASTCDWRSWPATTSCERYLVENVSRCSLIVALHEPPGNASCEHDEHERIVDCIARGDADSRGRADGRHLRDWNAMSSCSATHPKKACERCLA